MSAAIEYLDLGGEVQSAGLTRDDFHELARRHHLMVVYPSSEIDWTHEVTEQEELRDLVGLVGDYIPAVQDRWDGPSERETFDPIRVFISSSDPNEYVENYRLIELDESHPRFTELADIIRDEALSHC